MVVLALSRQVSVLGQTPVEFDAATVKLDQRGSGDRRMQGGPGTGAPGRVTWRKVWLRDLVATAFDVDPRNVSGPDWIARNGAQLYAFTATMPPDTQKNDFRAMLRNFLMEQFRMTIHHQRRMFPAYDLVVVPGISKLKASATVSAPDLPVATAPKLDADSFPILPPGHGQMVVLANGYHGRFQNYTMAEFAEHLLNWVPQADTHCYVVDKTGLAGAYDFTLKFDQGGTVPEVGAAVRANAEEKVDAEPGSGLPTLFRALVQQLGLKLVKAPDFEADTIVIDKAQRVPVGN